MLCVVIDTGDVAGGNGLSESKGDGAGPAAKVQQVHSWPQVGQHEGGLMLGRPGGIILPETGCYAVGAFLL